MTTLNKIYPQLLLLLVSWLLIYVAFGELFTQPNKYMFSQGGDGVKNYFVSAHYVKYGGDGRSTAMTYPYGELALYTDSYFSVVSIMRWVHNNIVPVSDYTIGVINFLGLFFLAFCPLFVFLILRRLQIPVWYAFAASLIIGFLSPQIQRLGGHFSLSYALFVPMVWYLLMRVESDNRRWLWISVTFLAILFFGGLHPYYVPLGAFIFLAYGFVYLLQHANRLKLNWREPFLYLAIGFGVVFIFTLSTSLVDTVSDRHPAPYGIFTYVATFESVFLPPFGPYLDLWSYFTYVQKGVFEGWSYVGVLGFFVLIFSAVRFVKRVLRKRFSRALHFTGSVHLNRMLWASTLILLLATAFPFLHFAFLLDVFPPLRQFRSLGRFAWIFYYVFTVYIAYYFFLVYRRMSIKDLKAIGIGFITVLFFFWGSEALINTNYVVKGIHKSKGLNTLFKDSNQDYSKIFDSVGKAPSEFQAMIPLPYFNNGSEKFYIYRSARAVYESLKANYDLNIPIATFHSARTSLTHSYNLVQLLSSELIEKEMLPDLNDKPILLLSTKEKRLSDSQALVEKATKFFENDWIELYSLPVAAFADKKELVRDEFNLLKDSLGVVHGLRTNASEESLVFFDYEKESSETAFAGSGSFNTGKDFRAELFNFALSVDYEQDMELSCWIYSNKKHASFPALFVELLDESGESQFLGVYHPKFNTEFCDGWVKATVNFRYKPGLAIRAYVMHENFQTRGHLVDNFLIRPSDEDVYHSFEADGTFYFNNYRIDPK